MHEGLGLGLLRYIGGSAPRLLAGLLGVTGFMVMWMSNAATAMVVMPMAVSIAALITRVAQSGAPVTKALLLAVAYAPCIGGLATFIGTPTNALLEGFVSKTYGVNLSLAQWMMFGVPVAVVLLFGCWLLLYGTLLRGLPAVTNLSALMRAEYAKIGAFTRGEIVTSAVLHSVSKVGYLAIFGRDSSGWGLTTQSSRWSGRSCFFWCRWTLSLSGPR